jgi:hypothetical protein
VDQIRQTVEAVEVAFRRRRLIVFLVLPTEIVIHHSWLVTLLSLALSFHSVDVILISHESFQGFLVAMSEYVRILGHS